MTSQVSFPVTNPPYQAAQIPAVALMALDTNGVPQALSAANPLTVSQSGTAYNTAANTAGYAIKSSAGTFQGISVNTAGLTSTATLYDGLSTAGTKLCTISTLAQTSLQYNIAFSTGLFIVLSGGTPADVTVVYR